jgi:hypothetical protein
VRISGRAFLIHASGEFVFLVLLAILPKILTTLLPCSPAQLAIYATNLPESQ